MEVNRELEVKLPLMGKSLELDPLPGQDAQDRFGVIWDMCDQPGEGLGYVVRLNDSRSCNILAWMGPAGAVYECDRPISFVMPGVPALVAARSEEERGTGQVRVRLHGSDELVPAAGFRDCFPNQVEFEPLAGKGVPGAATDAELARAVGPYAGRRLGWRTFVAVSYLAFCLLPHCAGGQRSARGTISDVLRSFVAQPLPDAVDSVIFRVMEGQEGGRVAASGFERYAARMLQQAGSADLRAVAARRRVGIARLSSTQLFWVRFGDDTPPEDRAVLLSVESCLNRLALIEAALRDAGESTALADVRESACARADRRVVAGIADAARACVGACEEENPYCAYLPVHSMRGGEWDVRTRFLRACEGLRVPFRLEYRFDCDAADGRLHVRFGLPPLRAFPAYRWDEAESRWSDCSAEVESRAACYGLRLAALLAGCAFGTSVGMREAVVTGCADSPDGMPLLSLRFERMRYLNRALYRIDLGTVARVGERGACSAADVASLLALLAPDEVRIELDVAGGLKPVEPLEPPLPECRFPVSADERPLPPTLAHLLHALHVRDLDGDANTDLRVLDEVHAAVEDAGESRLLAIARLEEIADASPVRGLPAADDVVAAAEAALRGDCGVPGYEEEGGDGAVRRVRLAYFPNLMTRCLVERVATDDDEVFEPVPAEAYLSRQALVKLYVESGDYEAAAVRARECALLAPTSSGLLLELAQLMLAAQRPEEAVAFLRQAAAVCVRQQMATVIYAHLGGAWWMAGRQAEALAAFVLARGAEQGQSTFDQAILHLVQQLGLPGAPSAEEAAATLQAQGVSPAPSEEARADILNAGVGFTDGRMPELAWPLVGALGIDIGNDVMAMMGDHLRRGLDY